MPTPDTPTPHTLGFVVALRDTMVEHGAGWGYRERRMALRRLAMPVIEKMWTTEEAVALLEFSPIVGAGPKQVDVRMQVSGLRDQFDLPTLFAIAYLGTGLPFVDVYDATTPTTASAKYTLDHATMKMLIQNALRHPDVTAMRSTGSKTGYVFGRNGVLKDEVVKLMSDLVWERCKDEPITKPAVATASGGATTTTIEETKTMEEDVGKHDAPDVKARGPAMGRLYLPPDTTLSELCGMIEHVMHARECERDYACWLLKQNMASSGQASRFDGAEEFMEMRGEPEVGALPRHLRPELKQIVDDVLRDLRPVSEMRKLMAMSASAEVKSLLPEAERASLGAYPDDDLDGLLTAVAAKSAATAAHATKTTTTTTTTTIKETTKMSELADAVKRVEPAVSSMIDAMLQSAKLPTLHKLMTEIGQRDERLGVQGATLERMLKEGEELKRKLAEAESRPMAVSEVAASHDGVIPSGTVEWVPAHKAFGLTKGKEAFGFKVPVWTWDGVHPHVPVADPHYVFRPFELMRVLYGIVANKRVYLHGHTGTGKTTLIEQVAARLGYAFMRLNFDSEISRMDLIGRDTLVSEGGTTVSRFVDGILPQMMQSPCIGCFDEIDFVRPDIAYVMQRMLEGDALVITEDGGRVVKPHPMFRAFATGNTVGQGDEHGMYQGARVQSTALLDRFSVWQKIDYLKPDDRLALIRNRVPALSDEMCEKLNGYITEHLQAFTTSKVLQPLSPRGFLALAEAMVFYMSTLPSKKDAVDQALESTILDRASVQDRVVLKGLASRVFG